MHPLRGFMPELLATILRERTVSQQTEMRRIIDDKGRGYGTGGPCWLRLEAMFSVGLICCLLMWSLTGGSLCSFEPPFYSQSHAPFEQADEKPASRVYGSLPARAMSLSMAGFSVTTLSRSTTGTGAS
jgi:hypothetical protein